MKTLHPVFEVVTTTAGAISIRHKILNETMHNPVGPWTEANALYIEPSGLKSRLEESNKPELVVFDVGLGAAANSLAVLHCHRSLRAPRKLKLVSFERDLELLRFALSESNQFEHFEGYEEPIRELLSRGFWGGNHVEWILREGEFPEKVLIEPEKADLVFYDPYSSQVNSEMWTVGCFRALRERCKDAVDGGCLFLNYSRATHFRTALLMAGFFVGHGPRTGLKDETTQASTRLDDLESPLTEKWLDRWRRSHARVPQGLNPEEEKNLEELLRNHSQFAKG